MIMTKQLRSTTYESNVYRSDVSLLFFISLMITCIVLAIIVTIGLYTDSLYTTVGGVVICVPAVILHLALYCSTKYVIHEDTIEIISIGTKPQYIKISDIQEISPISNYISAVALSSRRLKIKEKNEKITYISPLNREAFMLSVKTNKCFRK